MGDSTLNRAQLPAGKNFKDWDEFENYLVDQPQSVQDLEEIQAILNNPDAALPNTTRIKDIFDRNEIEYDEVATSKSKAKSISTRAKSFAEPAAFSLSAEDYALFKSLNPFTTQLDDFDLEPIVKDDDLFLSYIKIQKIEVAFLDNGRFTAKSLPVDAADFYTRLDEKYSPEGVLLTENPEDQTEVRPIQIEAQMLPLPDSLADVADQELDALIDEQILQLHNDNLDINLRINQAQNFATLLSAQGHDKEASAIYTEIAVEAAAVYELEPGVRVRINDEALEQSFLEEAATLRGETKIIPPALKIETQDSATYLNTQIDYLRNKDVPYQIRLTHGEAVIAALNQEGRYLDSAVIFEELANLAHLSSDLQLEKTLQMQAGFHRSMEDSGSAEEAKLLVSKENLAEQIKTTQSLPVKMILEAKLAFFNHDYVKARQCLQKAGWEILLNKNEEYILSAEEENGNPPWKYADTYGVPEEYAQYWQIALSVSAMVDEQEQRENTIEILIIEFQEDQQDLASDVQYVAQKDQFEKSESLGDHIAYNVRSVPIAMGLYSLHETNIVASYEQRLSFRNLLMFYLQSQAANSLDQAIDLALHDTKLVLPLELAEAKKNASTNYPVWKQWREANSDLAMIIVDGKQVIYNKKTADKFISDRQDMDTYWHQKIQSAEEGWHYDKAITYLDTILEADLLRVIRQIPAEEKREVELKVKEDAKNKHDSIVNPIINELKRQYGPHKQEFIAALKKNHPELNDDEAFEISINFLAEQSFQASVSQYLESELKQKAITILQEQGVSEDGPFSKELRQYALARYADDLDGKGNVDFAKKIATLIFITVPFLMAGGFVAGLAGAGIRLVAGVLVEEATKDTLGFAVGTYVLGMTATGWAFHTTSATMSMTIHGSAAFDNYGRECAISIGMMLALGGVGAGYGATTEGFFVRNFATGETALAEGGTVLVLNTTGRALRLTGSIATEASAMIVYEHAVGEPLRGGTGTLEEKSLQDEYLDAIALVIALKAGHEVSSVAAVKIKAALGIESDLDKPSLLKTLAKQKIFLLKSKDFKNLAIKAGKPKLGNQFSYTDPRTGNTFVNRDALPKDNLDFFLELQIQQQDVNEAFDRLKQSAPNLFLEFLLHPKFEEMKQKYLALYPEAKDFSNEQMLQALIAYFRVCSIDAKNLTKEQLDLFTSLDLMLYQTGLRDLNIWNPVARVVALDDKGKAAQPVQPKAGADIKENEKAPKEPTPARNPKTDFINPINQTTVMSPNELVISQDAQDMIYADHERTGNEHTLRGFADGSFVTNEGQELTTGGEDVFAVGDETGSGNVEQLDLSAHIQPKTPDPSKEDLENTIARARLNPNQVQRHVEFGYIEREVTDFSSGIPITNTVRERAFVQVEVLFDGTELKTSLGVSENVPTDMIENVWGKIRRVDRETSTVSRFQLEELSQQDLHAPEAAASKHSDTDPLEEAAKEAIGFGATENEIDEIRTDPKYDDDSDVLDQLLILSEACKKKTNAAVDEMVKHLQDDLQVPENEIQAITTDPTLPLVECLAKLRALALTAKAANPKPQTIDTPPAETAPAKEDPQTKADVTPPPKPAPINIPPEPVITTKRIAQLIDLASSTYDRTNRSEGENAFFAETLSEIQDSNILTNAEKQTLLQAMIDAYKKAATPQKNKERMQQARLAAKKFIQDRKVEVRSGTKKIVPPVLEPVAQPAQPPVAPATPRAEARPARGDKAKNPPALADKAVDPTPKPTEASATSDSYESKASDLQSSIDEKFNGLTESLGFKNPDPLFSDKLNTFVENPNINIGVKLRVLQQIYLKRSPGEMSQVLNRALQNQADAPLDNNSWLPSAREKIDQPATPDPELTAALPPLPAEVSQPVHEPPKEPPVVVDQPALTSDPAPKTEVTDKQQEVLLEENAPTEPTPAIAALVAEAAPEPTQVPTPAQAGIPLETAKNIYTDEINKPNSIFANAREAWLRLASPQNAELIAKVFRIIDSLRKLGFSENDLKILMTLIAGKGFVDVLTLYEIRWTFQRFKDLGGSDATLKEVLGNLKFIDNPANLIQNIKIATLRRVLNLINTDPAFATNRRNWSEYASRPDNLRVMCDIASSVLALRQRGVADAEIAATVAKISDHHNPDTLLNELAHLSPTLPDANQLRAQNRTIEIQRLGVPLKDYGQLIIKLHGELPKLIQNLQSTLIKKIAQLNQNILQEQTKTYPDENKLKQYQRQRAIFAAQSEYIANNPSRIQTAMDLIVSLQPEQIIALEFIRERFGDDALAGLFTNPSFLKLSPEEHSQLLGKLLSDLPAYLQDPTNLSEIESWFDPDNYRDNSFVRPNMSYDNGTTVFPVGGWVKEFCAVAQLKRYYGKDVIWDPGKRKDICEAYQLYYTDPTTGRVKTSNPDALDPATGTLYEVASGSLRYSDFPDSAYQQKLGELRNYLQVMGNGRINLIEFTLITSGTPDITVLKSFFREAGPGNLRIRIVNDEGVQTKIFTDFSQVEIFEKEIQAETAKRGRK